MAGTTSGVSVVKDGNNIDLYIYQGKTVNFEVIWGGATPIDITGYTGRLIARQSASSNQALVEFSTTLGNITNGGVNGKFTLSMSAAASAALQPCAGVYDFEITTGAGAVHLVMSGAFSVVAEVTK